MLGLNGKKKKLEVFYDFVAFHQLINLQICVFLTQTELHGMFFIASLVPEEVAPTKSAAHAE